MFTKMGYGVYFFFASLMILSVFFVFFLIPETKGIPLENMDMLFDEKPTWRAHGKVISKLREDEERFRHDVEETAVVSKKGGVDSQFEGSEPDQQNPKA